jgi:HAMP domain-containing protein
MTEPFQSDVGESQIPTVVVDGAPHGGHRPESARFNTVLQNVKVRSRLLILAAVIALLWGLVVIFSLTGIASVKSHYNAATQGVAQLVDFHKSDEAWYLADDTAGIEASLLLIHMPSNNPLLKLVTPIPPAQEKLAQKLLADALKYPASAAMVSRVHQLQSLLAQYGPLTVRYEKAAATGNVPAAMKALGEKSAIAEKLANGYGAATPIVLANLNVNGNQIGSRLDSMRTTVILLTIVSAILGGLIMLMIIRSITRPLGKVADAAKRFARGSVEVELDVRGKDEIATVADSFREAIASQKKVAECLVEFSDRNLAVDFEARSEEDVLGHAFLQLQERMRAALGDHATTRELQSGMGELLGTLQHLEHGLVSMNDGDLTVAVDAQLHPIEPEVDGESVGFVAGGLQPDAGDAAAQARRSLEPGSADRATGVVDERHTREPAKRDERDERRRPDDQRRLAGDRDRFGGRREHRPPGRGLQRDAGQHAVCRVVLQPDARTDRRHVV